MTRDHYAGCSGKVKFATYKQADRSAKVMRQNHERGCHVEAYHCKHCQHFHVGEPRDYGRKDARREAAAKE